MEESTKIIRELEIYLREIIENVSPIVVVYLFGSYAKGKEKARSDMDLAFLLDEKAYKADPFSKPYFPGSKDRREPCLYSVKRQSRIYPCNTDDMKL